jgi:arginine:ornithine antiporter / lysine permease
MVANRGETYEVRPQERRRDLIIAGIAVVYTLFLVFAGGLKFLLLSAILYGPGTLLYFWAQSEQGKSMFFKRPVDWVLFVAAVIGCIVGIYGLATGSITI